jgi:hypothetical protein
VTPQPSRLGRAFDVYRRTAESRSALALVVANAIPLVGVLFLGWSLWTILAVYWVENGIVGLWNIPRILLAEGALLPGRVGVGYRAWAVRPMPGVGRAALAAFFAVHYGLFWLVHGGFVLALPSFMGLTGSISDGLLPPTSVGGFPPGFGGLVDPAVTESPGAFGVLDWSAVGAAAIGLFISHGLSFFVNYVGGGEYRTRTAAAQLAAPYGRLVVLHVTIVLGGFVLAFLGAPFVLLVILVVLKIALDLRFHLREHEPMRNEPALAPA